MEPFAYDAFISYSHRDLAWGAWLQRRLETRRIPRDLRPAWMEGRVRLRGFTKEGLDAGSQNNGGEGFAHIVVCPQLKAEDLIGLFGSGGKHHDRKRGVARFDLTQRLPSVEYRHHYIQNDQRKFVAFFFHNTQCFPAVFCLKHRKAFALEKIADQAAQSVFIVCHKNLDHMAQSNHLFA